MKYIILYLILDATTGEQLELGEHSKTVYAALEDCDKAKADIGPERSKDGKVKVYSCASEKQVTVL